MDNTAAEGEKTTFQLPKWDSESIFLPQWRYIWFIKVALDFSFSHRKRQALEGEYYFTTKAPNSEIRA